VRDNEGKNPVVIEDHTIEISDYLFADARAAGSVLGRSVAEQIEHWCRIGKVMEENPGLSYAFIKGVLASKREADDDKLTDYQFG
jgi:chaperone required for assembly of F1-ATPase